MNKGFFDILDAEFERLFTQLGGDRNDQKYKDVKASKAQLDKSFTKRDFNKTRLNNVTTTLEILLEGLEFCKSNDKVAICLLDKEGKWKVEHISAKLLTEVFALEMSTGLSLPEAVALYTEALEKKFNEK